MATLSDHSETLTVSAGDISLNQSGLLSQLNDEKAILHLPITFFLFLLMGFGMAGNSCVIYVYRTRFRKTSGSFFILILAVLDLSNSCLCIPWEIYCLRNSYIHSLPTLCKAARFIQSFVYLSASLILVCVAFSRYFKIVKPLHCYSSGQAQSLTVIMMTMAVCLVWPQVPLSGIKTVDTRAEGIYGLECSISDNMQNTIYTFLFHGCLYSVFSLSFILMMVFYSRILLVVCMRGRTKLGQQVANRNYTPRSSASNMSERSLGSSQNISVTSRSQAGPRGPVSVMSGIGRTTRMLGLVTFVFLLGYVPFLTVQVVSIFGIAFKGFLSYSEEVTFELCMRSYFLSSAANPLIYSILNLKFRQESMVALKKLIRNLPSWCGRRVKGQDGVT